MLRMVESGLVDWWNRQTAGSGRCVTKETARQKTASRIQLKPLTLSNLKGPFLILLGGLTLAILVWILGIVVLYLKTILLILVWMMRGPSVFLGF